MLSIGITGGIGSGKTTVCRLFEQLGVPVYYSDDRAKWLMNYEPKVKLSLIKAFGKNTFSEDGRLDRAYLASIVFKDKDKLAQLNQIVHPAVFEDANAWSKDYQDRAYILREAALFFETGSHKQMDQMIMVYAPEEMRIDRVVKRDQTDRNQVMARIKNQLSDEEKIAKSDHIIYNDGSQLLIPQVLQLHYKLLNSPPNA